MNQREWQVVQWLIVGSFLNTALSLLAVGIAVFH